MNSNDASEGLALPEGYPDKFADTSVVSLPDNPRFLIVKLWAIGDILMATPLLRELKRRYPGCSIDWIANGRYASILRDNGFVDEVIPLDAKRWLGYFRRGQMVPYLRMCSVLRRTIREGRYDCIINLAAEKWWAAWFRGAPVTIGLFPRPDPGYMGRLYTKPIPRSLRPLLHNTSNYLLAAAALGIEEPYDTHMVLPSSEEALQRAKSFLQSHPIFESGRQTIVLHPGTSQQSKCWPPGYFGMLAGMLSDCNVVITGSAEESGIATEIAAGAGPANAPIVAAGVLCDLRDTVALVGIADVVVTGDTAVLHICSAAGKPFVAIYGSTRPDDNAPLHGVHVKVYNPAVSCSPCGKANCPLKGDEHMACMTGITPDRVFREVQRLLVAPVG